MRFLYLSISADHACSSPARQVRTSRSSLHVMSGSRNRAAIRFRVPSSWRGTGPPLRPEQFLDIPQCMIVEDGGPEVTEPLLRADEDIGTHEARDRLILRHEVLHPIVLTF